LDLSGNAIGEHGGQAIGRMLRHNTALVQLNLALNNFTEGGVAAVVTGMKSNSTLARINLSSTSSMHGPLFEHILQLAVEAAQHNQSLIVFDFAESNHQAPLWL
jgi:hypothetical protein